METRHVIYPVHEVVGGIQELLKPLGVASQIMAIDNIVVGIFEIAAGALSDGSEVVDMLSIYRVPRYQSYGVLDNCLNALNTINFSEFKQKHDLFAFDREYRLIGGDLYIDLIPRTPVKSKYELYKESIEETLNNGGYVPDRVRREFGL